MIFNLYLHSYLIENGIEPFNAVAAMNTGCRFAEISFRKPS